MARNLKAAVVTALLSVLVTGTGWSQDRAPDIAGRWKSTSAEAEGPIHAMREFQITSESWAVVFRAYADAAASKPLFRIETGGIYVLGGSSATVQGAFEGIFPATRRQVTAESAEGVAMFAGMGCKLEQGVAKTLTVEGCGFLPPLMQAMGEYDLVALRDGKLFFGDRAGDLTKSRPARLTPYPLVKQ